ncbi:hypothetical protein SEPCBS119000_006677 [Sporothrix epigloea]|uniref:Uncharacterized protein n=1 Tax=Sporothrix epigloea TaxID=1892477 RepID=A0ABP0E489_9PEZI
MNEYDYNIAIARQIPVLEGIESFWDWWIAFSRGLKNEKRLKCLLPTHPGSLNDVKAEICGPMPRRPDPEDFRTAPTVTRSDSAASSSTAIEPRGVENRELEEAERRYRFEMNSYRTLKRKFERGLTLVEVRMRVSVSTLIYTQLGQLDVKESIAYLYTTFAPDKGQLWSLLTTDYMKLYKRFSIPELEEWLDTWSGLLQRMIREGTGEVRTGLWIQDLGDRLIQSGSTKWVAEGFRLSRLRCNPDYCPATMEKVWEVVFEVKTEKVRIRGRNEEDHSLHTRGGEEELGGQQKGPGSRSSQKRPRSGTHDDGPRQRKAIEANTCEACSRRGHVLEECRWLFSALRPDSLGPMQPHQERKAKFVLEKVQADPELAARYEAEKKAVALRRGEAAEVKRKRVPVGAMMLASESEKLMDLVADSVPSPARLASLASVHMVNDLSCLCNVTATPKSQVIPVGISEVAIEGWGDWQTWFTSPTGRKVPITLPNTAYCPVSDVNVISLRSFADMGLFWTNETGEVYRRDKNGMKEVLGVSVMRGGQYFISLGSASS